MTDGLAALFERADLQEYSAFNRQELEAWGLQLAVLPFLVPATTPQSITCPGCHEACLKQIRKQDGQPFVWCDEPADLGHIPLTAEDLAHWQVDMAALAKALSALLGLDGGQEISQRRVYDLGILEGHALFLLRGIGWEDAGDICQDARIRNANPILIHLSPPPEALAMSAVWIGQLLRLQSGELAADITRIQQAARSSTTLEGNVFRRQGDMWLVRFDGKEAYIKNSNGMVYLDHLLHHPNQEVPALTLQALVNKAPPSGAAVRDPVHEDVAMLGDDPVLDEQGLRSIMAEIERLKETEPDSAKIPQLEAYLRNNTYQGKSKGFVDANERARVAVTKAIKPVIKKLEIESPSFAAHLQAFLQTGIYCIYKPKDKLGADLSLKVVM